MSDFEKEWKVFFDRFERKILDFWGDIFGKRFLDSVLDSIVENAKAWREMFAA